MANRWIVTPLRKSDKRLRDNERKYNGQLRQIVRRNERRRRQAERERALAAAAA